MNLRIAELDARSWAQQSKKPDLKVGVHESPWGWVVAGFVGKDLAALYLVERGAQVASAMNQIAAAWPGATIHCDNRGTASALKNIVASWSGKGKKLRVLLKGTAFQLRVWRALLEIPRGATSTYGEIARRLRMPRAARAVGGAVGANPVGVLVPCHRVLAGGGKLGGYAWGVDKKKALLLAEGVAV